MKLGLWLFFLVLAAFTFGGSAVEAWLEIWGMVLLFALVGIGVLVVRHKEIKK